MMRDEINKKISKEYQEITTFRKENYYLLYTNSQIILNTNTTRLNGLDKLFFITFTEIRIFRDIFLHF